MPLHILWSLAITTVLSSTAIIELTPLSEPYSKLSEETTATAAEPLAQTTGSVEAEPELIPPGDVKNDRHSVENRSGLNDAVVREPSSPPDVPLVPTVEISNVSSTPTIPNVTSQTESGAGPIAPEPIQDYDEWTKRKLEEQHRTKVAEVNAAASGTPSFHHGNVIPPVAARNYAASECNAKVLLYNKEAKNAKSILNEKERDEYMLNPCQTETKWFVVELCETILPTRFELANFELFSSSPKNFRVWSSERYPSPEWTLLGEWTAADKREIQEFQISSRVYAKVLKVELLSHYGSEHFCPLSLIRVFGISMVEEYEAEAVLATNGGQTSTVPSTNLSMSLNTSAVSDDSSNDTKSSAIENITITTEPQKGNLIGSVVDIAKDILSQVLPAVAKPRNSSMPESIMAVNGNLFWRDAGLLGNMRSLQDCFTTYSQKPLLSRTCRFIGVTTGLSAYQVAVLNALPALGQQQCSDTTSFQPGAPSVSVEANGILGKTVDQLVNNVLPVVQPVIQRLIPATQPREEANPDQQGVSEQLEMATSAQFDHETGPIADNIGLPKQICPSPSGECVSADKSFDNRSKVVGDRPIPHSTSTRTSGHEVNMSGGTLAEPQGTARGATLLESSSLRNNQCRILFLGHFCFFDQRGIFTCGEVRRQCHRKQHVWTQVQLKCEAENKRFWLPSRTVPGPTVPKPSGAGMAAGPIAAESVPQESSFQPALSSLPKLPPIDPVFSQMPHDGTSMPGTSLPSKESIFMRLSNRIRSLELNISLSSQYLNELSRRYRLQQEDNQRLLNESRKTVAEVWLKVEQQMNSKDEKIAVLQENLQVIAETVKLLRDQSLYLQEEAWKWHLFLVTVEVMVFSAALSVCLSRWQMREIRQLVATGLQPDSSPSSRTSIYRAVDLGTTDDGNGQLASCWVGPTSSSTPSAAVWRKVSAPGVCSTAAGTSAVSLRDERDRERRRSASLSPAKLVPSRVLSGLSMSDLNPNKMVVVKAHRKRRLKATSSLEAQIPHPTAVHSTPACASDPAMDTGIEEATVAAKASLSTQNRFSMFSSPEKACR